MPSRSNVVKFRKRKNVNIGVVIFVIIAIYMIVNIYLFLSKSQISIFEVKEESLAKDTIVTGIIIRDETLVTTSKSGYVNYYQREGSRVAKNTTVYSIDENKTIYDKLSDQGEASSLSEKDINLVKVDIKKYKKSYSDASFSKVYSFKDEISGTIQEVVDMSLLDNMHAIVNTTGISTNFEVNKATESGIISYRVDSLNGIQADAVNLNSFNEENYTKTNLRTVDIAEANGAVYKLITSETWSIIAPINEDTYQELKERESINFTILSDNLTLTAPISVSQNGSEYYVQINLNRYMIRYLNERFLEIDLNISSVSGYKIPLSAITKKEFYLVPTSYLTYGGDSNQLGIIVESYDATSGEPSYIFTPTDIYYQDDTYSYIDKNLVAANTYILNSTTNERNTINQVGTLEGVYNVNKGYAVFRRIERIVENEAYCIIKKDTSSGVSLYDHIALEATDAIEGVVIY